MLYIILILMVVVLVIRAFVLSPDAKKLWTIVLAALVAMAFLITFLLPL
jgi:hypothetical protein